MISFIQTRIIMCIALRIFFVSIPEIVNRNSYGAPRNLTFMQIPRTITSLGYRAFAYCKLHDLVSHHDLDFPYNITSIPPLEFRGATTLYYVIIPESVTEIGVFAFEDCINLRSIIIPHGVTLIDHGTFRNCVDLNSVTMHGITSIGPEAFRDCKSLNTITIPNSVTEIGSAAFFNL